MKRFIEGVERTQGTMFPALLDEYIAEDNGVRVIDAFIDSLNLNVPDQQISETDADARSMATSGRGTGMVGYNMQTAVDTKHHLIIAYEVTNVGHDRTQLANMAKHVQRITGRTNLIAIAGRGYFSGVEIQACELQGLTPLVPKSVTSNSHALELFDKRDFIYLAQSNKYVCPAGQGRISRLYR